MKYLIFSLLCFLLFKASCSSSKPSKENVKYDVINNIKLSSKAVDSLQIFITNKPSKEYIELGILSYTVWEYEPVDTKYYNILKEKAAEIGGNGIIILESRNEVSTNYVTKQNYQAKVYRAMVFIYK